jgi:hypothetical protein
MADGGRRGRDQATGRAGEVPGAQAGEQGAALDRGRDACGRRAAGVNELCSDWLALRATV